jgi:ABC-2 type transport system permease protein
MKTIFRKELTDIFSSARFMIFMLLAILVAAAALYTDYQGIRGSTGTEFIFLALYTTTGEGAWGLLGFLNFMAVFLIPVAGISLGFDAISSERTSGTLSRVLSQPIYRDNVINAKFLAGVLALALTIGTSVLLVAGYGLYMTGVPPASEEIYRLILFMFYCVVYGAFWMGLAIFFSIIFRRTATSLIVSVGIWLFMGIIYTIIAPLIANTVIPVTEAATTDIALQNLRLNDGLLRVSPTYLFIEASTNLLQPPLAGSTLGGTFVYEVLAQGLGDYMLPNPLSLGQTLILVWPQLTTLLALTLICFAGSYIVFMRQEVRAT